MTNLYRLHHQKPLIMVCILNQPRKELILVQMQLSRPIAMAAPPCYHFKPDLVEGFKDAREDVFEGDRCKETTIAVNEGEWIVWFVERQKGGKPDTINMSEYEGGFLKFAIKADAQIPDLVVGIRSANITPGEEIKRRVSVFTETTGQWNDGKWHEVSIPLSSFSGSTPELDLSRIQTLFVIGSSWVESGGTDGIGTFWVDHIRWTAAEE